MSLHGKLSLHGCRALIAPTFLFPVRPCFNIVCQQQAMELLA